MNHRKTPKIDFRTFMSNIFVLGLLGLLTSSKVLASSSENMNSLESQPLTMDIIVILSLIIILIALFLLEPVSLDIIAISIPVILIILKPWTNLTISDTLSGFSNKATLTVLAMFIISGAVRKNGFVQIVSDKIIDITGKNSFKQLVLIVTLSGIIAGFLNNTPVVAIFTPMIITMTRKTGSSPSKLLIPLSYGSMMGGMITLIGTSTNLLASDVSNRLIGQPFSMFEFTKLGLIVFFVGTIYLITIGHRILPSRVSSDKDLTDEYFTDDFFTELIVKENSSLIGKNIEEVLEENNLELEVTEIIGAKDQPFDSIYSKPLQAQDRVIIRTDLENLESIRKIDGVRLLAEAKVGEESKEISAEWNKFIEVVILPGSILEGRTLEDLNFFKDYQALALALRRGNKLIHKSISEVKLKTGDRILLLGDSNTYKIISKMRDLIIVDQAESRDIDSSKMVITLCILAGVITLAALDLLPIVLSAFLGVIAMVVSGCISSDEIYEYIDWRTIFLLAGLIPLGLALEKTGSAQFLTFKLLYFIKDFPVIVILGIFYLFTAVITNIISNNASVVLMIPVAVGAANQLGVNPFAFVLAVTFAASTAFLTPIGYQTNLMVYSSGGYKFRDYLFAGAPLQILLAIITPIFIDIFWGL